jgi:urease accessory protein
MDSAPRQRGRLDLCFAYRGNRTTAVRSHAVAPLQCSRLRYDDPGDATRANLSLIHLGGVLDGDHYDLAIDLEPAARARVVGAAATMVHPRLDHGATQQIRLHAGAASQFCWWPGALILNAGAQITQQLTLDLAADADLEWLDVVVPGRLARGERDAFMAFESQLTVVVAGRCRVVDRLVLRPGQRPPAHRGVLGTTPVLGTLLLVGPRRDPATIAPLLPDGTVSIGCTGLPGGGGVLVRCAGPSLSSVLGALEHVCLAARRLRT